MSLGRCLYVFCLFGILERTADVREKLWPVKWRGCCALPGRRRGARSKKPRSRSEMRDAGVCSGGCSRLPCSPWVRLCRERSEEEISGKRHCGGCCFAVVRWLCCWSGLNRGMAGWQWKCMEPYSLFSPESLASKCLCLKILFRGLLGSELCWSAVFWGNRQPSCWPAPGSHSVLSALTLRAIFSDSVAYIQLYSACFKPWV